MFEILLFFILQLINVILATIRSILLIKANKHISAIFNAVSYAFYVAIIKLVTQQEMLIVVSVTFVTNLMGVYAANWILGKFKKDKLWRITATIRKTENIEEITEKLHNYGISHTVYEGNDVKIVDIYSKTQGESQLIKEVLKNRSVKYFIVEMEKSL